MRTQFAAAKQGITELTTDLAQKTLLQYGIKDELSRTELEEYVSSELITTENDVTTLMRWISAGDKMNDKAARVIFDMVANANNRVRFNTHKFGMPGAARSPRKYRSRGARATARGTRAAGDAYPHAGCRYREVLNE